MARAASGARILGDDVQHLIAWYHVLRALRPTEKITSLAVEAADAGNVDDLTIERETGEWEYWQVKASVDATGAASGEWLLDFKPGKRSLLQRLYASWRDLSARAGRPPRLVLATTKNVDRADPVITLKDRRGRIADGLREASGSLLAARTEWAAHLGVSEPELLRFLDHLELRTGIDEHGWLEKVQDAAAAAGVRGDDEAIAIGLRTVRDWVKDPRRVFTTDELCCIVKGLHLELAAPRALVVIQALDSSPRAEDATAVIDCAAAFGGEDARTRRCLSNPADATALTNELQQARQQLRRQGLKAVEVDGPMRLPLWFLAGVELGGTAGFNLSARCGDGLWTTFDRRDTSDPIVSDLVPQEPVVGAPWVVSVNVARDISNEVRMYAEACLPGAVMLHAQVSRGVSRQAFKDGADAMKFAVELRDRLRDLRVNLRPPDIHLFLAMPGAAALFLGHLWDRMPDTYTYWDLNEPGAYEPAFIVRN